MIAHNPLKEEESQDNIKIEDISIEQQQQHIKLKGLNEQIRHQQIEMKEQYEDDIENNNKKQPTKQETINNNIDLHASEGNDVLSSAIPDSLKKTFFLSLTLFIIGLVLVIVGICNCLVNKSFKAGITFWVLGFLVLTPGGYYSMLFYKYKKANNQYEKEEILDQIPEL